MKPQAWFWASLGIVLVVLFGLILPRDDPRPSPTAASAVTVRRQAASGAEPRAPVGNSGAAQQGQRPLTREQVRRLGRILRDAGPPVARRRALAGLVSGGCDAGHWVQHVMADGEFVQLEDRSLWQIDAIDQSDTILWTVTDEIVVCDGRLINTDDGETVSAARIR